MFYVFTHGFLITRWEKDLPVRLHRNKILLFLIYLRTCSCVVNNRCVDLVQEATGGNFANHNPFFGKVFFLA
jgi:hypothetical protein